MSKKMTWVMIEEMVPTKTKQALRVLNVSKALGNKHIILHLYSIKLLFGFETDKSLISNRL
jgi:hypothetical protein